MFYSGELIEATIVLKWYSCVMWKQVITCKTKFNIKWTNEGYNAIKLAKISNIYFYV